jgi:ribonuclease HII
MLKKCFNSMVAEAGCDEAGRGCLAGPVFAAAVIFPPDYENPEINDSKQLSEKIRDKLRSEIEHDALAWAVGVMDNNQIDRVNILRASIMAMHEALGRLKIKPAHIIIDGRIFYAFESVPYSCIVKGDCTYMSIAAASILAKTYRDEFMMTLHEKYTHYQWNTNKGYATAAHRHAIEKYGISPYHRRSFVLYNDQLKINF